MSYLFPGRFRAIAVHVVDGDTLDLRVDVGFHLTYTGRFRLLGVDTPELNAKDPDERLRATSAKAYVIGWLTTAAPDDWPLRIVTRKDPDSFGRYLVEVWKQVELEGQVTEANLAEALLAEGLATRRP